LSQHGDAKEGFWRAYALYSAGSWREALTMVEEVLNQEGVPTEAWWLRAGLMRGVYGDFDPRVLSAYDEALLREPSNLYARVERADILRSLGKTEQACAEYESVMALTEEGALRYEVAFKLGCVYWALNRPHEALSAFHIVLEHDPTNAEARELCDRLAGELGLGD
jgi:tetratricopeptide (TPR) repeat protein